MVRALALTLILTGCSHKKDEAAAADSAPAWSLTIDDPEAAAWMGDGKATVTGRVDGLSDLRFNGMKVGGADGSWASKYSFDRGINLLEIKGTDQNGDARWVQHSVIAGKFTDPGKPVEDALTIRVNQGGLDGIASALETMVDDLDIDGALTSVNPVLEKDYGALGLSALTIEADIGSVDFSKPQISATPYYGVLEVSVDLPNFDVWVPVRGKALGIDYDAGAGLYADDAEVTLWLGLDARNGKLVIDLYDAEVALTGFSYDVSLLPSLLEDYFFVDTIRGIIEKKVRDELIDQVPPLLEETLGGLDLSFETELLGTDLSVGAEFARAGVDEDGLAIAADVDVFVPGSGGLTYAGVLDAKDVPAVVSTQTDLAMSLSDDLLNRILFEVWKGGLLELTLSTDDGSLDPLLLAQLGAETGTIQVSAQLPPVALEKPGAGEITAQIGELLVTIDAPGSKIGDHVELAVALFAGLDLVIADNVLKLDIGDPELHLAVRDNSWAGIDNETLSALLLDMLPINALLAVANIEFPLPDLAGISIAKGGAARDPSGVHTHVSIALD